MRDRGVTEDGQEVEYPMKRSDRLPRVIGLRDALVVCATCTAIFGGLTTFALRSMMREEIGIHNNDPQAHPVAMKPVIEHISRQNGEENRLREIAERISRIEDRVTTSSESIARIEERLQIHDARSRK